MEKRGLAMIDVVSELMAALETGTDQDTTPVVVVDRTGADCQIERVYYSAATEALVIQTI
jgi:hypothetical protein